MEAFGLQGSNRMASTHGEMTGVFSVLPSLPTSGPFAVVKCFCLLVGWKMQRKMVLEMLRLCLSINPYPKAAGPPAAAFLIHPASWDLLIYWSSLQEGRIKNTEREVVPQPSSMRLEALLW